MADTSVFILVGTYEELLLCYRLDISDQESAGLEPIFTDHSHSKSIRAVAISETGRYFASGSSDETIQLFSNLFSKPRQIGSVHANESSVTHLRFVGDDRLIAMEDDGSISIWKALDWDSPVHQMSISKRKIPLDLSVHPSGRLALTIASGDRRIRVWDMVQYRQAACVRCFKNNLEPIVTFWSSNGESYGVLYPKELEVYHTSSCQKRDAITFESTATSAVFLLDRDYFAVGFQNGQIAVYGSMSVGAWQRGPMHVLEASAENGRVKSMFAKDASDSGLLASASSSGWVRVFRYARVHSGVKTEQIASINVGARITCMAVAIRGELPALKDQEPEGDEVRTNGDASVKRKRKAKKLGKRKLEEDGDVTQTTTKKRKTKMKSKNMRLE